jgi:hypothetical protein
MEPWERSLEMREVVVERPPPEIGVQMRPVGQLERDTGAVLVMVVVADPRPKLTVMVLAAERRTLQELVAMEVQPVHETRWEPI